MTRTLLLAMLLGVGCAAKADRPALPPTAAVAIASELTATCVAAPHDHFAYDPADSANAPTCRRPIDIDDDRPLEIDANASAPARERAVAEFLSGVPADPPVD